MNALLATSLLLAQKNPPPPWFFAAFLIFFPALWLGLMFVLSRLLGWRELADAYGIDEQPPGTGFTWQSAQLKWLGGYNNCLKFIANRGGFWVRPMWPFRVWHRGLFFPWEEVIIEPTRTWGFSVVKFRFTEVPSVTMTVSPGLAKRLKAAAGEAWPDYARESEESPH